MYQSILAFQRHLYLKAALAAVLLASLAYYLHSPFGAPNGGSWLGYTLGGISAILVLWLMWFGVRKRRYGPGKVKLQGWLSAHVYLGLALIVLATLHTGFQFGFNIHTLVYALLILVVLSGAFGVYTYVRYPTAMTENRRGSTFGELLSQISQLDRQCRDLAMRLGDEINTAVYRASSETRVGGGLLRQLSGRDPSCPTAAALAQVEKFAANASGDDIGRVRQLISAMSRKCGLLGRARRDAQLQTLMQIWLFVHVPFSFALLAALIAHVFSVFFYW